MYYYGFGLPQQVPPGNRTGGRRTLTTDLQLVHTMEVSVSPVSVGAADPQLATFSHTGRWFAR
jgi:hypothetical protein